MPSVLGGVTSGWAAPCVPYAGPQVGFVMLPDVGSGVWIEFEGGDVSFPIWTGCYWNSGDIPSRRRDHAQDDRHQGRQPRLRQQRGERHAAGRRASTRVVLDSSGVTATAGSGNVAVGASGVSVNNGALEVM